MTNDGPRQSMETHSLTSGWVGRWTRNQQQLPVSWPAAYDGIMDGVLKVLSVYKNRRLFNCWHKLCLRPKFKLHTHSSIRPFIRCVRLLVISQSNQQAISIDQHNRAIEIAERKICGARRIWELH
jgi:hypothetical protein